MNNVIFVKSNRKIKLNSIGFFGLLIWLSFWKKKLEIFNYDGVYIDEYKIKKKKIKRNLKIKRTWITSIVDSLVDWL